MELLQLMAGLGLFMIGMKQLEDSLGALAGVPFRRFLRDHANTPLRGIAVGTAATAILQSSSLVSLLVLAFVGAGIMQLSGAIGVILGANLGTTVTGWLVATLGFKFNVGSFALAFVGVGGLGSVLLPKGSQLREVAAFAAGLGLLLFGLNLMKEGVEQFASQFDVSPFAGLPLFLMALLGVAVTAVVQSSSATMMIALSALHGGVIGLEAAAAFAAGTGVGTTVTAMLGAVGGSPDKKRVAAAHVGFNVLKATVALLMLHPLLHLLGLIPALQDPLLLLVAFHTAFNVLGILIALPIIGRTAQFLGTRFVATDRLVNRFLQGAGSSVPDAGGAAVIKEVRRALGMTIALNRNALGLPTPPSSRWIDPVNDPASGALRTYADRYERLKRLEGELAEYVVALQTHELSFAQGRALVGQLEAMRLTVISAKSVKDIRQNLVDLRLAMRPSTDSWLRRFESSADDMYRQLDELDPDAQPNVLIEALAAQRNRMRDERDAVVSDLYRAAGQHGLNELEISTLFNVNRELHSSSKALLRALASHLLQPETLSAVEAASV